MNDKPNLQIGISTKIFLALLMIALGVVTWSEDKTIMQFCYLVCLLTIAQISIYLSQKKQGNIQSKTRKLFLASIVSLFLSSLFMGYTYFVRYKATCIGGNGYKCYSLARENGRKANTEVLIGTSYEESTIHYLELACQNDVYDACVDLIKNFESRIDTERTRNAYKFASKYNKADLFHLAKFELRQKNIAMAEAIAKESCEIAKDIQGCMLLGSLLIEKGEKAKGVDVLKLACNSNSEDACNLLYAFYKENGTAEESALYLKRLCSLGNSKACEMLESNEALPH